MQTYNREICKCKPPTSDFFFFFWGGEVKGIVFLLVRASRYRTKVHANTSACHYSELGHKTHFEFIHKYLRDNMQVQYDRSSKKIHLNGFLQNETFAYNVNHIFYSVGNHLKGIAKINNKKVMG